jgi:FkbH-like protein
MHECRKCLVWDLDNTLWDGVCLEGPVAPKSDAIGAIVELDQRGILHSVASRGDEECARTALREHALEGYFLAPRINWLPKSRNILAISRELNVSLDAIAFIDDDAFEREQVAFMLPDVFTIDAVRAGELVGMSAFSPADITAEARERRAMVRAELERRKKESTFATREEFLRSCQMRLRVREMEVDDIPRVRELMTRTHQLNTTGLVFDPAAIHTVADGTSVVVAELEDVFGRYGIIATAVVQQLQPVWRVRYLAVSCRVMGRGIERALLSSLVRRATKEGCTECEADFRDTGRNAMMRTLYGMMGFRDAGQIREDDIRVLQTTSDTVAGVPVWVEVL